MARSTSKRRSSALPILFTHLSFLGTVRVQFTVYKRRVTHRAVHLNTQRPRSANLRRQRGRATEGALMIFKGVRDGKPYPEHGLSYREWSRIPPRQIRLDEIVTTTTVLALDRLLSEDSTFYGDLFPHAVRWQGVIYLEDGLHRAVRSALRNRTVLHARLYDMDLPYSQQI
ncbi:hypothetical protein MDOR_25660 [Mycolicibacterium doricum]|uniref:Type II toxin-antitoxin system VapB family antitoxin n=2 Tax=Mycolicibacterium doricum TaxID=126673 RepID=A0A7I7VU53_9MYCO|nr:hypothetical protein MDOR_25660 [Mycolicibacterium doricum]